MNAQAKASHPGLMPLSIIRALWKRRSWIAVSWFAGTAAAIAVVYSLKPVYSAEALILVESQKIPETFVASTVQTVIEARLDTLKQQVLSGDRLWQLIDEFNLYAKERRTYTREEVLHFMRKDATISLERGWTAERPGAFRVAYEAHNPKIAADVTNRIGQFFIDENSREREIQAAGTSQFFSNELAQSRRTLLDQEAKLRDFKLSHNGELPQQEAALLASVSQNKAELLGLQEAIARTQQSKLVLESTVAAAEDNMQLRKSLVQQRAEQKAKEAAVEAMGAAPAKVSSLDRARAELAALRLRYEDKHPDIQRLLKEIVRLELGERDKRSEKSEPVPVIRPPQQQPPGDESIIAEKERIVSLKAQLEQTVRDIKSLDGERARLLKEMADLQKRIDKLPIREQQLAAITRDYETSKANYRSLLDKKLAADVASNMEKRQKAERFVMLDPARPPEKAVKPKRALLIGGGSLFCLLLAASVAFLIELKRDVVLGEWELPPDTTIIARLPKMEIRESRAAHRPA